MALQRFEVPGSVLLRDVQQVKHGETPIERAWRLAQKATIEGVRILEESSTGKLVATSGSEEGVAYFVDVEARCCSCSGCRAHFPCKHLALALVKTGRLERPAEKVQVECKGCNGQRGHKRQCGGNLSDWVWEPCDACKGRGFWLTSAPAVQL